jgi:hypothetical protein
MNPGANIPIATVPNLRDVGGWRTTGGGRVRRGLAYRSTALNRLDGEDLMAFAGLGIRSVYDLRTARRAGFAIAPSAELASDAPRPGRAGPADGSATRSRSSQMVRSYALPCDGGVTSLR